MGLFDNSARLFNMSFPWGLGKYRQISTDDEVLPADSDSLSVYVDEEGTVNVSESLVLYKSNDPIDGGVEHTYSKGNLFIQGLNKALTTVPIGGIILYPMRFSFTLGLVGYGYLQSIPEGFVPCLGQTLTYPDGSTFQVPYLFSWTRSAIYIQRVPFGTFQDLNEAKSDVNFVNSFKGPQLGDDGSLRLSNPNSNNSVTLRPPDTIEDDVILTLPTTDGAADQVLKTDGNGVLEWTDILPPGTIQFYAANTAPPGWMKANGASNLNTYAYRNLHSVISNTFGGTAYQDGVTNIPTATTMFSLPDLRGEFIRGWDDGRGVDSERGFGSFQGDDFKSHTHNINNQENDGPQWIAFSRSDLTPSATSDGTGYSFGGQGNDRIFYILNSGGTETRPRNIALLAIIKY